MTIKITSLQKQLLTGKSFYQDKILTGHDVTRTVPYQDSTLPGHILTRTVPYYRTVPHQILRKKKNIGFIIFHFGAKRTRIEICSGRVSQPDLKRKYFLFFMLRYLHDNRNQLYFIGLEILRDTEPTQTITIFRNILKNGFQNFNNILE